MVRASCRTRSTKSRRLAPWLGAAMLGCILGEVRVLAQAPYLCSSPDWFAVQRAQQKGDALSALCKGELDVAEGHSDAAASELRAVIAAAPQSTDAYAAHSTLLHLYLRLGRFHDANSELIAMLQARPTAPDLLNMRSMLALLTTHPDFAVTKSSPATVRTEVFDGNVFAPVTVQGAARSYMLDTGMPISMMTRSEAKSLGLRPEVSSTSMNDISGLSGPGLQIVMVDRLKFGSTELRNVPFMVVEDTQGAFVGIPEGHHGILGIQPLVAANTLGFGRDGMLSLDSRVEQVDTYVPMLYGGEGILTQIVYRDRPLTVTLDSGATQTTVNPPFAALYPEVLGWGKTEDHTMNGISGSSTQRSVSVPRLELRFGRQVELAPAVILLNQTTGASAYSAANLGYDMLQQAKPFTLDFGRLVIGFPSHQ